MCAQVLVIFSSLILLGGKKFFGPSFLHFLLLQLVLAMHQVKNIVVQKNLLSLLSKIILTILKRKRSFFSRTIGCRFLTCSFVCFFFFRTVALGILLGVLEWDHKVPCINLVFQYTIGYLAIFGACMFFEFLMCLLATRGSILDTNARASMQYLLYVRLGEYISLRFFIYYRIPFDG